MRKIVKIFWKEHLITLLFMLGSGISTTIVSFVNASILNSLIKFNLHSFLISISKLIVVYMFFLLFTYLKILQSRKTSQKMAKFLRDKIIDEVSNFSPREFKKSKVGDYTSWLSNDINQIEDQGFTVFFELLSNIINLSLALISLLYIHWSLFIVTIIEIVIIIQLPRLFKKKMAESTKEITKANEGALSKTTNLLSGFSTFYIFKNLMYLSSKLKHEFLKIEQTKNKQTQFLAKIAIIGGLGNVIGQIISYSLTGYLVLLNLLSAGILATTASLSANVFNTVGNLSQYIAIIKSVEPLFDKIDISLEKTRIKNSQLNKIQKGIELRNLTFGYDNMQPIIKNMNYTFELGEKYALSGESGSGKSTILNLIIKDLQPTDGKVLLNGLNIKNLSSQEVLSSITYIEQTPYIFNNTVRENISLGDPIEDEKIKKVLKSVGLKKLSEQLDTVITENGGNFSGGQKQRLALARGLVRNKNIILLDEITSSLDVKTAVSIEKFILSIPNITVIMISHHISEEIKQHLDGILKLEKK
ncbi:ABC transporter ATP-binding protein [Vagococcus entomophilus]|uniref:ABC transporter ATP-binding protein n=1 Tax=Vagococcus entomophilus TaxID=1160095 RepID=A0A430AF22_9ENTE|nr:ABC transporter ATP-binding protein [Vagococcus entomophilus]RSU06185.1 hypothetical protein CBF30_10740 [Vagococcus entomophilus]